MNIFSIIFTADDKQRTKDFLSLPKLLYDKKERMQNESEELAVLTGTHTLSRSFPAFPFSSIKTKKRLPVPLSPSIQGTIPHILVSSRVKMTLPSPDFYLKLPFKLQKKKTKPALSVPWMLPSG